MKIYINSKTKDGAWGGGNQFIKALKGDFFSRKILAENVKSADVVLFNGYQEVIDIFSYWILNHSQKRVYRLGPVMSLHRPGFKWKFIDRLVVFVVNFCIDLVIFQSKWSYDQAVKIGFNPKKNHHIIFNAVDKAIFYKKESRPRLSGEKIKLIYEFHKLIPALYNLLQGSNRPINILSYPF